VRGKLHYYNFRIWQQAMSMQCSLYHAAGWKLPTWLRSFQVEQAHRQALKVYRFRFYPGKITLIRATGGTQGAATVKDLTLGWQQYAGGGLEIYDVVGAHMTMFDEPNVRGLAKMLESILAAHERGIKHRAVS
jgi:thioesterase domain-containing protein